MGIDARMIFAIPAADRDKIPQWSWDLAATLGAKHFDIPAITLTSVYDEDSWDKIPELAGTLANQDGPDLPAPQGKLWAEVHLVTRYYGEGYERGDILTICAVAEWLERSHNFEPLYGGDSSGVLFEPFGKAVREKLFAHFYSSKGRDYYNYRETLGGSSPKPPRCGNCVADRGPRRYGWGSSYAAYYCPGCGDSYETQDDGATWQKKESD